MDLDILRLVVALADGGDLARAAAATATGRRAAGARIAHLERRIGAILFEHKEKSVQLTRAGDAFVREARLALAAAERAERLARSVATEPEAIDIGVVSAALFGPIRDVIEDPAWVDAGLTLRLHEMRADEQAEALAHGRLVMGFVAPPFPPTPRLDHRVVAASGWVAVAPTADTHLRKAVSLQALARKPLIMFARDQAAIVHDGLIEALAATGQEPNIVQTGHQWPSILAMVALGLGSALVPAMVAKRLAVEGATVLPLSDGASLPPWPIALIAMPQPPESNAAKAIALVKRRFSKE